MDKKQLLNLLYGQELKELANEQGVKKVTASSTKRADIEVLHKILSLKELERIIPDMLRKRAARQRAKAIDASYLLSLLHNYELERLAKKTGLMVGPSITGTNRAAVIKKLSENLSPGELKAEVRSAFGSRGRFSSLPSKNVVAVQECLYTILERTPKGFGAYELEKLIIDELPRSISAKGQKFELESNLSLKECQKRLFSAKYGGFEYFPSFRYGSELAIDVKFFSGMDDTNLVPLFIGIAKVYRKSFNEVILFIYPPKSVKLGAEELEGLNTENIYIVT